MKMHLTVLRHAQSIANVVKGGNLYVPDTKDGKALQKMHPTSVPLSGLGVEQAQITGQQMVENDMEFDVVIYSPLARTVETLNIIEAQYRDAGKMLAPIIFQSVLLREIDFGNVAWMTKGQAKIYFPWFRFYSRKDWHAKPELREGFFYERTPSGGESYADVYLRVYALLMELAIGYHGKKVLLITHGGTTRVIRMILEEKSPRDFENDLLVWRYRNCDFVSYLDGGFLGQYSFVR